MRTVLHSSFVWRTSALAVLWLTAPAVPGAAHPAPFSYVDLQLEESALVVRVVAHAYDIAYELGLSSPDVVVAPGVAERNREAIASLLRDRLSLEVDGSGVELDVGSLEVLEERHSVAVTFRSPRPAAVGRLVFHAALFPYDPVHQTFVNVYRDGRLERQAILDRRQTTLRHDIGSAQAAGPVFTRFVREGVRHIAIGPDHVLFLVGLLLLGGGIGRLVTIVTAFTVAHSITLSMAVLGMVAPPAHLVEPAIALSIVYVGADNLLVSRESRDQRAWIALVFGLIHGFGFASVLAEIGLPRAALGLALFSFNLGVEIGQIAIVLVCASVLVLVRRRSAWLGRRIAVAGSVAVLATGLYWFVERLMEGGAS